MIKRLLACCALLLPLLTPDAHAVRTWGNGRILIQHYNANTCSAVTGVDAGDAGAVCWQTSNETWWDWTGSAWVERATGGGAGGTALEWINVKEDYLAVGDGVADDTDEIDNAVSAMESATDGAVLFFPPGKYRVTQSIGVALANPNNVILGFGAELLVDNPTCDSLVCSDDETTVCAVDTDCGELDGAIFSITLADRLEIAGLTFTDSDSAAHDALGGEQTHGIVLNGVTNVDLHDLTIGGFGDEAVNVYGASSNVAIRDSTFTASCHQDSNCGSFVDIARTKNAWVTGNYCNGTGGPAYASCFGTSCAGGSCGDDDLRDIRFADNVIENASNHCIALGNADGNMSGLQVQGNVCRDPAGNGIRSGSTGDGKMYRTLISGNTIEGGGKSIDEATAGAGIYIGNNTDGSGVISDNYIYDWGNDSDTNSHVGIRVGNGGWAISGNVIDSVPVGIVAAQSTGAPNVISGNRITNATGAGISSTGDDMINNNFVDGASSCIYISAGVAPGQAFANSLNNCTTTGIRLNGTDVWAVNNTISNSAIGITGSGTSPRAFNNKMTNVTSLSSGTLKSAMEFGPTVDMGADWIVFDDTTGTVQPDISEGVMFRASNTAATTYDSFTGATNGQFFFVHFSNANTTIDFSASNLKGNSGADWTPSADEMMSCVAGSTNFYCQINDPGTGTGDVTASATIGDEYLVRGDGAVKGVQNSNVTLDDADNMAGLASIDVAGSSAQGGYIRFKEDTDFGTDYVEIRACSTDIAASFVHEFPCADAAGVLTSDGVGVLSWSAAGAGDILSVGSACASGACDSISIADGQKIDLSGVTYSGTGEGLILPFSADCTALTADTHALCHDTTSESLCVYDGAAWDCGGGGGTGDVTDVLGCDGPNCDSITSVDGNLLDMGAAYGAAIGLTEGVHLPTHATTCAGATALGMLCMEADDFTLWNGDGTSAVQVLQAPDLDTFAELDALAADKVLVNTADAATLLLKTLTTPIIDLTTAAPGTTEGRLAWKSTENRMTVGESGGAVDFYSGPHTTNTDASTKCSGTTTYLDGEDNCDTLDGVEDFETPTNHGVLVGTGSVFNTKALPDCDATAGLRLQYDQTTQAFTCNSKVASQVVALTVESPTATEDITLRYFVNAVTVTSARCVGVGTTDVDVKVMHSTDRNAAGNAVFAAARTVTSTTTGDSLTLGGDVTVPASSWMWFETSEATTSPTNLNCSIFFTVDK